MSAETTPSLPDGLVAFVKRDCPTCVEIEPVLAPAHMRWMRQKWRMWMSPFAQVGFLCRA